MIWRTHRFPMVYRIDDARFGAGEFLRQWEEVRRCELPLDLAVHDLFRDKPGWLCRLPPGLWGEGDWAHRSLEGRSPLILRAGLVYDFPLYRLDLRPDPSVPRGETHWFRYA